MTPYFEDSNVKLFNASCFDAMAELEPESIQCVVTSPPYWGLRKYSGEQEIEEWGCAYGLEQTPDMYIKHTIEILNAIRRVLRKDGVVFWNIDDTYASSTKRVGRTDVERMYANNTKGLETDVKLKPNHKIKPKNLLLIPFRLAIAAQDDNWYVRSVIVWSKPNPIPEGRKDRPTGSHEYILMLSKSSKYYWDAEAVAEPSLDPTDNRKGRSRIGQKRMPTGTIAGIRPGSAVYETRSVRTVWEFPTQPYPKAHFAVFPEKLPERCILAASRVGDTILDPFSGAGTTLWVAKKLGRNAVGIDISESYCSLALMRTRQAIMGMDATTPAKRSAIGAEEKQGELFTEVE